MKIANFSSDEFIDQNVLNSAETLTRDSLLDITGNLHTPGLINASALSFSYSGLNITVSAPLPFRALFSDGTLASANGTVDGESSSSATVDFSSLVPSTGSITAYLVAVSGSVAQEAFSVVGPPVGHPDFSPSYQPYTAYAENQDTIQFQATTTAPDNETTLFIASTVLSAGQTVITSSSTTGQVRAGAILSRNGEVLAADLASGAAATNVGTLGGSLVGTLPNPTLAAGAAASNVGALGGSLVGTLPNPTLASGAAATNVGALGGSLVGTLPNPTLASGAAATNVGTLGGSLVGTLPNPTLAATGATSGTYINPVTITVDEDGRISDIANVSNWNVPENVTAGGTIVASGTATAAAATSPANLIPYGQAFQFLQPATSESITLGNVLHTVVQPSGGITADIAITLEPGSVGGQDFTGYGSPSGSGSVTYQTNVTTGTPYIELPDGSQVYSWTIPAGAVDQSIYLVWGGTNWRARTFGQEVVAPATQNNAATQLSQLFIGNRKAVFTANGTFTVPSAVTTLWISGCAGGGGGGGGGGNVGSTGNAGSGGGAGGGGGQPVIKTPVSVSPGDSISITIGAGGAGGAAGDSAGTSGSSGGNGGNSVITNSTTSTTLLTLTGGGGGGGGAGQTSTSAAAPAGTAGGNPGTGYPTGTQGSDGNYTGNGGTGASGPFGGGGGSGRAANNNTGYPGANAYGYGGGGGGGGGDYGSVAESGGNGGNGAPGFIVIEW